MTVDHFSSEFQGYQTPPEWLDLVRQVGPIALDPATTEENPCDAEVFLYPPYDGLNEDWRAHAKGGLCYVNSPYGDELPDWAAKIADEGMRGCEVISLTPARTDTAWFRKMTTADQLCFVRGRIKFYGFNPLTGKFERGAWSKKSKKWMPDSPAGFPSLFAYWGPKPDRFREVFGPYGWCPL